MKTMRFLLLLGVCSFVACQQQTQNKSLLEAPPSDIETNAKNDNSIKFIDCIQIGVYSTTPIGEFFSDDSNWKKEVYYLGDSFFAITALLKKA